MAEDTKPRSPMERRIEELITQCKGVPPGEVMQLLLKADSSQDFDLEKKLQELFEKYNDKSWSVKVEPVIPVKIFSDYIWPFCYIGKGIVDTLKKEFPITDEWVSFEIHPETPAEGVPLAVRLPDVDWDGMYENLRRTGSQYRIAFGNVTLLSNSRLAMEASEFARDHGKYDLFSEKVFYAYFTDARDIGRKDVVMKMAGAAGLDVEALRNALLEGRYAQRLRESHEEGQRYNITGVPAFIINGKYKIVGAQPLEVFRDALKNQGWMNHAATTE